MKCKLNTHYIYFFSKISFRFFPSDFLLAVLLATHATATLTRQTKATETPNGCSKVFCPAQNGEFAEHLRNPDDCGSFCKCDWGVAIYFACPGGLHFNTKLQVCDWPEYAGCEGNDGDTEVSTPVGPNPCEYVRCPAQNTDPLTTLSAENDCGSFCECFNGRPIWKQCSPGLHFNEVTALCEHPLNAACDPLWTEGPPTTSTTKATATSKATTTNIVTTSKPQSTTSKTTSAPNSSTSAPNGCEKVKCPSTNEGNATHWPNPEDCGSFCKCDWGKPVWFACPPGLHFNPVLEVCDWPENAGCVPGGEPEPEVTTPGAGVTTPGGGNTTPGSGNTTPGGGGTTSAPNGCEKVKCPSTNEGNATHWPNPEDCGSFCKCDWGKPVWFACPPGLHFNPVLEVCDWPENAGCVPGGEPEPEVTTPGAGITTPGGGNTTPSGSNQCANANCPNEVCGATNVPNPDDCGSYCKCENGIGSWKPCPPGLFFNPAIEICDWPINSNCEGDTGETTTAGNGGGTTKPPVATTTAGSGNNSTSPPRPTCPKVKCPAENGLYAVHLPNPDDCGSFCKCDWGVAYYFDCPDGLHFNADLEVCDWPLYANCDPSGDAPGIPDPLRSKKF